jgi:hypothetical protein
VGRKNLVIWSLGGLVIEKPKQIGGRHFNQQTPKGSHRVQKTHAINKSTNWAIGQVIR